MKKISSQCCVPFCPGTSKILYRFPIPEWESVRMKEWVTRIASIQLTHQNENRLYTLFRVCDLHFSDHCRVPDRTRLKKGSLPTLLLPGFRGPSNAQTSILQTVSIRRPELYAEKIVNRDTDKENCLQTPEKKPSFFVSVKTVRPFDHELQEVCRVCFKSVEDNNYTKLCEDSPENKQFKYMLAKILPELDQKMYPEVAICSICKNTVISSYKMKEMCANSGERLKQIIEREEYTLTSNGTLLISEITPHMKVLMDHNYAQNYVSAKQKVVSSEQLNFSDLSYIDKQKLSKIAAEKIWGRGPYLCDKCGFSCVRKITLRYHLIRHSGHKPQVPTQKALCELCGKVCMTVYSLNKHLRRHQKIHRCSYCGKVFLTVRTLQTHYRTTHRAFQQCSLCMKAVRRGKSMKAHLLVHKYEKKN